MNTIYKSIPPVVVATVFASGIVLLTLQSFADSNLPLDPPPGPFFTGQKSLSAPIAPKEPINESIQIIKPVNLKKPPVEPSSINSLRAGLINPSLYQKPLQAQKIVGNAPELSPKVELEPSMEELVESRIGQKPVLTSVLKPSNIANIPTAPKNISIQPVAREQPRINVSQPPIWMQKGINNKGKNIANGLDQNNMGMPNIDWNNNFSPQQYMYIPVPMVPYNGVPPQMPMFNRNINPLQNNWMPNLLNNMPAPQQRIAPVQKDTK